jgi:uncharacterized membrane protein
MKTDYITFLIVLGSILFCAIHFVSLSKRVTQKLKRILSTRYKALYALIAGIGFSMMMLMRFNTGTLHKESWSFMHDYIHPVMLMANIFIVSAYVPGNHFKKLLEHPMLVGIALWSGSHFLLNEHLHHSLFFGVMFVFSIVMIIGLLKRDGHTQKAAKLSATALSITLGIICFALIMLGHGHLSGVELI